MAGVNEVKQSAEEKASAAADQRAKEKEFAQELVEGLDLSSGVRKEIDKAEDEREEEVDETEDESREEEGSEEESTEEEASEEESDEESSEDSPEEDAEEEEEADPKTKSAMQKRIDELTREKRLLEAKLKEKGESGDESEKTDDPEARKLSKMSVQELRELKSEVKLAVIDEKDPKERRKLVNLESKIDDAIADAPKRFESQQLSAYQSAVRETAAELGEKFSKDAQQAIFKKAGEIFAKSPSLQRSVEGQAVAWQMAADFYKETSSFTAGKSRTKELERENNKLKKKTSLDVAVRKGNTKTSENERLFHKAKSGNAKDKLAFFKNELKTDEMLPANLRGR